MKYCPYCGNAAPDDARFCENCGAALTQPAQPYQASPTINIVYYPEKKNSGLGILAFILALAVITAPIAVILAIIDLCSNKNNKHGFAVAGLIIGSIYSILMLSGYLINKAYARSHNFSYSSNAAYSTEFPQLDDLLFKVSCQSVDYQNAVQNPDGYNGTKVTVRGRVIKISDRGNYPNGFILSAAEGDDEIWFINFIPPSDEEGVSVQDNLTVYGILTGTTSYPWLHEKSITIPVLEAKYIESNGN